MKPANRDLLVLSNANHLSPEQQERQLALLHTILYHTENWQTFCSANEILDVNRLKIISKPHLMQRILSERVRKPFVFICNKN